MVRPTRIAIVTILTLTGCAGYENQSAYEIRVGEQVDLYILSNSCCRNCWLAQERVVHTGMVNERVVEETDHIGGSNVLAWTFEGRSPCMDTIRIANLANGITQIPRKELRKGRSLGSPPM